MRLSASELRDRVTILSYSSEQLTPLNTRANALQASGEVWAKVEIKESSETPAGNGKSVVHKGRVVIRYDAGVSLNVYDAFRWDGRTLQVKTRGYIGYPYQGVEFGVVEVVDGV